MKPNVIRLFALCAFAAVLSGCVGDGLNHDERVAIVGADSACDQAARSDRSDPSSPCFVARAR